MSLTVIDDEEDPAPVGRGDDEGGVVGQVDQQPLAAQHDGHTAAELRV